MARLRKILISVEFDPTKDDGTMNELLLRSLWLTKFCGSLMPIIRVKMCDEETYVKDEPFVYFSAVHDIPRQLIHEEIKPKANC